jgi:hypothetical protein
MESIQRLCYTLGIRNYLGLLAVIKPLEEINYSPLNEFREVRTDKNKACRVD